MTLINLERTFCEDEFDVVYFSRAHKNYLSFFHGRVIVHLIEQIYHNVLR